jgi:hypothetical protein
MRVHRRGEHLPTLLTALTFSLFVPLLGVTTFGGEESAEACCAGDWAGTPDR